MSRSGLRGIGSEFCMKLLKTALAMLIVPVWAPLLSGCGSGFMGRPVVNATEPPVIPVGLDAFRMWDHWAYLRIGQRTYMTSTYDRRGSNESADASHFLYQLADDRYASLDIMGKGVPRGVGIQHRKP
jgi:hypothetical protein